ncbi:hypothetical protein [Streptomyces sp. NPDC059003]|uniref:hypothetical protein n=1 Tax=Streptomyces sp. NPDC059003 TaxID=3346691 RepID=UPI0036A0B623
MKIGFNPFTSCLTSQFSWVVTLSPEVSGRIHDYRPRLPHQQWAPVAVLVPKFI